MKTRKLFAAAAAFLIITGCKQGPVTGGDPNGGDGDACVTDIQQAMDDYNKLMNDDDPSNDPAQPPVECDLPDVDPAVELDFDVVLKDFSPSQEEKMMEALRRAKIVLNSAKFKERVLNFTYNGKKAFVDNKGHSNAKVYETIMNGAETLYPTIDHEMDLDITLYYSNNSTVGYTYPDTVQIWVNSKFFNSYNYGQVAANAVHEWTHKLGYGHSYYNNSSRPYSVPYGIGTIIRELVNEL